MTLFAAQYSGFTHCSESRLVFEGVLKIIDMACEKT